MKKEKPYKFRQVPSVTPPDIWPYDKHGKQIPPERKSMSHAYAIAVHGPDMDRSNKQEKRK